MMKYILIHEETNVQAIVETFPTNMNDMLNDMNKFHIQRTYDDSVKIHRFYVYAENEDGKHYETFIFAGEDDFNSVFKELYPNDTVVYGF